MKMSKSTKKEKKVLIGKGVNLPKMKEQEKAQSLSYGEKKYLPKTIGLARNMGLK